MWVNPESMKHWMCAGNSTVAYIVLNPVVGGQFQIDMMTPDGQRYIHTGKFLEIRRPEKLVFTWHSSATAGGTTRVTVEFRDAENACELVLTHESLPDEKAVERHRQGWSDILSRFIEFSAV